MAIRCLKTLTVAIWKELTIDFFNIGACTLILKLRHFHLETAWLDLLFLFETQNIFPAVISYPQKPAYSLEYNFILCAGQFAYVRVDICVHNLMAQKINICRLSGYA